MKIGDRVKVISNKVTGRRCLADRYGHIKQIIPESIPPEPWDGGNPGLNPFKERAVVEFHDEEATIPTEYLKVVG